MPRAKTKNAEINRRYNISVNNARYWKNKKRQCSKETKQKISKNNTRYWKGKKFSTIHRLNLSISHKNIKSLKKGKTYEELYSYIKAKDIKNIISKKCSEKSLLQWKNPIIRAKMIFKMIGIRKTPFTEEHRKHIGNIRRNKTYEELFGKEKTVELKNIRRLARQGLTYNKIYGANGINIQRKISFSHKKLWKNPVYAKQKFKEFSIKPNKPEKILKEIIKNNNLPFNYVGDGKIWFRGENHSFNPDFLSKNPKHIIEVFGDYWHNKKDHRERDKERLKTYKKYGYKTLVIWEHELKNINKVLNKINIFLYRRKEVLK